MRRKLGDLIWGQSTNGNSVGQILAQLKRDIALIRSRPVKVAALEEISPDLGTITAGRFIASSDSDPLTIIDSDTEGNAPAVSGSGVVIDGDGIPVSDGGDKGNIIGYNSATPTVWVSAADGKLYAGGGALAVDGRAIVVSDAITALEMAGSPITPTDYQALLSFQNDARNASNDWGGTPAVQWKYYQQPTTNLIDNPDFETGDFTNWTETEPTNTAWTVQSSVVHGGTYAARLAVTNAFLGNALLLSDRQAITATAIYELSGWVRFDTPPLQSFFMFVQWHTAGSGGSVVRSDAVYLMQTSNNWYQIRDIVDAPVGATHASITIQAQNTVPVGNYYFDDIGLKLATITYFQGAPKLTLSPNGLTLAYGPIQMLEAPAGVATPAVFSAYNAHWEDTNHQPHYTQGFSGQDNIKHYGDYAGYLLFTNATTQQTLYSRTITANSLGANGTFIVRGMVVLRTTAAATKTFNPIVFDFGGTTLFSRVSGATGATSGNQVSIKFECAVTNQNDAALQRVMFDGQEIAGSALGTDTSVGTPTNLIRANASAEDTASDQTFSIFFTPSATNNTVERVYVEMLGPYYSP